MKIYTKTGDNGTTSLFGGKRVAKNDIRMHACGTIDELNVHLGYALSLCEHTAGSACMVHEQFLPIQEELFVIGAHCATPANTASSPALPAFSPRSTERLERAIDEMDSKLPALQHFILPGGTMQAASLHIARAVCRRAERILMEFTNNEKNFTEIQKYLNRLSDFLFVLARFINDTHHVKEQEWEG